MSDLAALQHDFAASLRRTAPEADSHTARWIEGDDASVARRLDIYRANTAASAGKALTAAYPVIRQVVGDAFFQGLAREYLRASPSMSGDLGEYGAYFATFLSDFEHAKQMPYLPDLARLEWSVHRAYGAADVDGIDPTALGTALAAVQAERLDNIQFEFAPGTVIVESIYPLARIWTIHQPEFAGEFGVDWSVAERVLVARDGYAVHVSTLGAGEAAFIESARHGTRLAVALTQALQADAAFDLGALLGRALTTHLICSFTL